jgi:hypothetical protein
VWKALGRFEPPLNAKMGLLEGDIGVEIAAQRQNEVTRRNFWR